MENKKEKIVSQVLVRKSSTINEFAVHHKGSMYEFAQEMGLSLRRQRKNDNHIKNNHSKGR